MRQRNPWFLIFVLGLSAGGLLGLIVERLTRPSPKPDEQRTVKWIQAHPAVFAGNEFKVARDLQFGIRKGGEVVWRQVQLDLFNPPPAPIPGKDQDAERSD
jgi:hypothetical protein